VVLVEVEECEECCSIAPPLEVLGAVEVLGDVVEGALTPADPLPALLCANNGSAPIISIIIT
jgi:hypothetical protein